MMKIKFSRIHDLLNEDLSLIERGVLITLLLLKDSDPKIFLAKAKAKINFSKEKEVLTRLHENNLIEWSGYKTAKKSLLEKELDPAVVEVFDFMNALYESNFNPKTKANTTALIARLKEYTLDEIKLVVANRYAVWKNDPIMSKHLNPTTIFRPSKFPKYHSEAQRTKQGESVLNARKIDLKIGDKITYSLSQKLTENDIFEVKVQTLRNGKPVGAGRVDKKTGKEIALALKKQKQNTDRGADVDAVYFYNGR